MGLERLANELKRARGTMSQKAWARQWELPLSTLGALEQQVTRRYHSQTLAKFDRALGRSAWAIYTGSDQPESEVTVVPHAEIDELRHQVAELTVEVARIVEGLDGVAVPSALDVVVRLLNPDELAEVVGYAHFVISRRRYRASEPPAALDG